MISDLQETPELVHRESVFALTLGAALLGAGGSVAVSSDSGAPLVMLVGIGLSAWAASAARQARLVVISGLGVTASLLLATAISHRLGVRSLLLLAPWLAPVTAAVVLMMISLLARLDSYARAQTHEDGTLARLAASRWLLFVALVSCGLSALIGELALGLSGTLVALFAAVRWALARDRLTTDRQWIQQVRDDEASGWQIVDPSMIEALPSLSLRPLVRGTPMDGVLVRAGVGGPYRGGIPVALAPRREWREVRSRWTLPRPALRSLAALLALGLPWWAILLGGVVSFDHAPRFLAGLAIAIPGVFLASRLTEPERRRICWALGVLGFALGAAWFATFDALPIH